MVAPIQEGYYLIGRDRECQIRPKTRSVSRNHCLIHYGKSSPEPMTASRQDDPRNGAGDDPSSPQPFARFHVLDLRSTAGTKINGTTIKPRQWYPIASGAELRCGKIAWRVIVPADNTTANGTATVDRSPLQSATQSPAGFAVSPPPPNPSHTPSPAPSDGPQTTPKVASQTVAPVDESMLNGSAWQEADVAAFLAAHDDADRENRYESIRTNAKLSGEDDSLSDIDLQAAPSVIETSERLATTESSPAELDSDESVSSDETARDPKLTPQEKRKKEARQKAEAARRAKQEKKKRADRKRTRRSGPSPIFEKIKTILAILVAVCVISLTIYQFVQFRSGPSPKVVEGID